MLDHLPMVQGEQMNNGNGVRKAKLILHDDESITLGSLQRCLSTEKNQLLKHDYW
jgi:hypothetical protein